MISPLVEAARCVVRTEQAMKYRVINMAQPTQGVPQLTVSAMSVSHDDTIVTVKLPRTIIYVFIDGTATASSTTSNITVHKR
jgi:hypothetical protein